MERMNAVGDGVRERVLLRVDFPRLDGRERFREIHDARLGPEELERPFLDLAWQHADAEPFHIVGYVNGSHAIRHVPEPVLEVTNDAKARLRLDPRRQGVAE